jgi:putative membrane protein
MRVAVGAAVAVLVATPLYAHEPRNDVDAAASLWDAGALAMLAAMAALYAVGSRRLAARGARVRRAERASFWCGWITLAGALAPPMDAAAARTFSMHMAQHELLMLVGAPLLIVGRPITTWLWAFPDPARRRVAMVIQGQHWLAVWRGLTTPTVAWLLHGAAVWVWHLPTLYEAAVRDEAIHAVQHATFVGSAVLFWWGLVYGRYGRLAYGASALFLFTTMVHTGVLGALFALSTEPYYGIYAARASAAGIDPVTDQQLAGLYMWIPAGVVLTVCGLLLLLAWIAEADRRSGARVAVLLVAAVVIAATTACGRMPHEREARALTGGDPFRGRDLIRQYGCDSCHTIPGIASADGTVGPPLTKIAMRTYLAGHLENTPENMIRWIQHPRQLDPRTAMPEMGVTLDDSRHIAAFLYTLR